MQLPTREGGTLNVIKQKFENIWKAVHQKRFSKDLRNGNQTFKIGSGEILRDIQAKGRKFVSYKIMRILDACISLWALEHFFGNVILMCSPNRVENRETGERT